MPRMAFIGLRISWLIAARKRDLARLAAVASSRRRINSACSARSSASALTRRLISRVNDTVWLASLSYMLITVSISTRVAPAISWLASSLACSSEIPLGRASTTLAMRLSDSMMCSASQCVRKVTISSITLSSERSDSVCLIASSLLTKLTWASLCQCSQGSS